MDVLPHQAILFMALSPNMEHIYNIPQYNILTNCSSRRSGGVSLYTKGSYVCLKKKTNMTTKDKCMESKFVDVCDTHENFIIGNLYRRSHGEAKVFLSRLEEILVKMINLDFF